MTNKKAVAVVTATRAEYGLLQPLIRRVFEDNDLKLKLFVTGTHLSADYGATISEIRNAGFPIDYEIPILEQGNNPYDVSVTMANALTGFAKCFRDDKPDMLILLGDRTEMLGIASAAMNERIPIAHIAGGEVTVGAVDDCVRHALTKMSYLHFTSTDVYRRRVIQMGEDPGRVFNVGSLSVENILAAQFLSKEEMNKHLKVGMRPFVLVTFHPVTLEASTSLRQVEELCEAMSNNNQYDYLITYANSDVGGSAVNQRLKSFCEERDNARLVSSLGMTNYLSAVKYAEFVLGNSSSGITEAPILGTPTVNIGDRQRGRLMADTIICCEPRCEAIMRAMQAAKDKERKRTAMFGDGHTSESILHIIKKHLFSEEINLKKQFYDMGQEN